MIWFKIILYIYKTDGKWCLCGSTRPCVAWDWGHLQSNGGKKMKASGFHEEDEVYQNLESLKYHKWEHVKLFKSVIFIGRWACNFSFISHHFCYHMTILHAFAFVVGLPDHGVWPYTFDFISKYAYKFLLTSKFLGYKVFYLYS